MPMHPLSKSGRVAAAWRVMTAPPRWLWRQLVTATEWMPDVGHSPNEWREEGELESPYAGWGHPTGRGDPMPPRRNPPD